ncbi:MAG: hypothetical protein IPL12_22600 [Bacteroidetes bacterium]|nr:hypothetical protein [Bacteroidota bacterium]
MKIESLAAYSTASSLLLGLSNEANAQMTYFNIDPDATVFGDMDYPIDLNLDGVLRNDDALRYMVGLPVFGIFMYKEFI